MGNTVIQLYIKELNQALRQVPDSEVNQSLSKLIALEARFARRLRAVAGGKKVYKKFIEHIMVEKSLREARPFFRERESLYKDVINRAILKRDAEALHGVRVNFLFCSFAIKNLPKADPKLLEIYEQIKAIRNDIIHKHLHYALNRAKSFGRNSGAVNSFSDLIQIANEALIVAVDKYVPGENASPFHVMALGRMISHLISSSAQAAPVTLGGSASKKLYQIKRLLERVPGITTKEVSDIVGMVEEDVLLLMNATRAKSLDESLDIDDLPHDSPSITLLDFLPSIADEHNDPYLAVEKRDLLVRAAEVFQALSLLEQKALRLKGVNFKDLY